MRPSQNSHVEPGGAREQVPWTGGSTLTSLILESIDALCLAASAAFGLSLGAPRLSGLLVRVTSVSLVVTCTLSVLRSSTVRLAGLKFPEAVRLCAGLDTPESGDGTCLLDSRVSLLKLSWPDMRGLDVALSGAAAVPFALLSAPKADVLMPDDMVAARYICWRS